MDEGMKDRDEGMKGKEETNKILFLLRSFELGFSLNIVSWHGGEGIECEQNLSIEVKRNFKLFQWFARDVKQRTRGKLWQPIGKHFTHHKSTTNTKLHQQC
eukprot:c13175_g1_i1.p1 GENE.c13175_g1_i1~~c13175_g1_i1.p1  ORF type:complete len:101 (-),score=16.27 c13175_g1_i1:50-352(-)